MNFSAGEGREKESKFSLKYPQHVQFSLIIEHFSKDVQNINCTIFLALKRPSYPIMVKILMSHNFQPFMCSTNLRGKKERHLSIHSYSYYKTQKYFLRE